MNPILVAALSNAVVVIAMAVLVYLTARLVQRPAIVHALWVLVLVKLVTPPLIEIPITIPLEVPDQRIEAGSVTGSIAMIEAESTIGGVFPHGRESRRAVDRVSEVTAATEMTSVASSSARADRARRSSTAVLQTWLEWLHSPGGNFFATALLAVWGLGTGLWFSFAMIRLLLFHRTLKRLSYRIPAAEARCGMLAARLGCRVTPALAFVDRAVSPMLWGCGGRATLVFPAALWKSTDGMPRDALLLHELAHFRRGDYWVRLLELVATGLFWWHPVVWLARREIGRAEEECCDAWVVDQFNGPPRPYARAIVSTLDFIAEYRPAAAPLGSGIGSVPFLKQRLRLIMERSVERSMSARSRLLLILLALLIVPLHPLPGFLPVSSVDASTVRPSAVSDLPLGGNRIRAGRDPSNGVEEKVSVAARGPVADEPPAGWWNRRLDERWASVTSGDGRFRLTASTGHRVTLTDLRRDAAIDLSAAHITVACLTSGNRFVAGSLDGSVRLYDLETGEPVSLIGQHQDRVTALSTTADGRRIVSGSRDGAVILWDAASGSPLATWTQPTLPVTSVRISPNSATIAVAAGDWKLNSTSQLIVFAMQSGTFERRASWTIEESVAAVEFLSDRSILTAAWSGRAEVRDLDGTLRMTATINRDAVSSAAFSPHDKLASRLQPVQTGGAAAPVVSDDR